MSAAAADRADAQRRRDRRFLYNARDGSSNIRSARRLLPRLTHRDRYVAAQQPRAQQPAPTTAAPAQPAAAQPATPAGGAAQAAAPAPARRRRDASVPAAASSHRRQARQRSTASTSRSTRTVEKTLAPTAFSVDQDKTKSTGKEVIVARAAAARAGRAQYLRHRDRRSGQARRRRDRQARARPAPPDCPPTCSRKYQGKPVILATAVINAALTDLAQVHSAADDAGRSGPRQGHEGVGAGQRRAAQRRSTHRTPSWSRPTPRFWPRRSPRPKRSGRARGKADAVKFAQTARDGRRRPSNRRPRPGNWNDVKTHDTTLGQQCASCHGVIASAVEDGSFCIKPRTSRTGQRLARASGRRTRLEQAGSNAKGHDR